MVCFIRGRGDDDMDHGRKANLYSANAVSVVGIASDSVPPKPKWRRMQAGTAIPATQDARQGRQKPTGR